MRWIQWALDHLFVVIVIATVVAGWVSKIRKAWSERPRGEFRGDRAESDVARDIQEEIRRKIAERSGEAERPATPPPLLQPAEGPSAALRQRLERKLAEAREREEGAIAASKRRRLEAEARALESEKLEDERTRATVQHAPLPEFPSLTQRAAHPLIAGLREHASLRRAIILREIIDPPLSLR